MLQTQILYTSMLVYKHNVMSFVKLNTNFTAYRLLFFSSFFKFCDAAYKLTVTKHSSYVQRKLIYSYRVQL